MRDYLIRKNVMPNYTEIENQVIAEQARDIVEGCTRLDNDINGNPRYYVGAVAFMHNGEFYRPKFAKKYRGKRYGAGWVFQSYSLQSDIEQELKAGICYA